MISEIARRYAKALLSLTKQKGNADKAFDELKIISTMITSDETFSSYFANPLISPDQKAKALSATLEKAGLSEEVRGFLILLASKQRIEQLPNIVLAYQDGLDREQGLTRGTVRAAKPLSDASLKSLEQKISGLLKKKIILSFKEDPKLLGGVVAEVGGWTFDDSIETHLKKLNDELNRGAL